MEARKWTKLSNNLPPRPHTPDPIATQSITQYSRSITEKPTEHLNKNNSEHIMVATITELKEEIKPSVYSSMSTRTQSSMTDKAHFWLAYSAASSHISGNLSLFKDLQETSPITIQTASGEVFTANQRGTIRIRIVSTPDFNLPDIPITLTDVIYVPKLKTNLLSVGKMVDANVDIVFTKGISFLTHRGMKIAYSIKENNLFVFMAFKVPDC